MKSDVPNKVPIEKWEMGKHADMHIDFSALGRHKRSNVLGDDASNALRANVDGAL